MGERNVVRTAEVYRAYSGIAAATVSGVLRMSPIGARAIDVGGVAVAQRGVRRVSLCFAPGDPRPPDSLHGRARWHDEIDERSVNFNRHFIEA